MNHKTYFGISVRKVGFKSLYNRIKHLWDVEFGLDKDARFASTLEHYQEIV